MYIERYQRKEHFWRPCFCTGYQGKCCNSVQCVNAREKRMGKDKRNWKTTPKVALWTNKMGQCPFYWCISRKFLYSRSYNSSTDIFVFISVYVHNTFWLRGMAFLSFLSCFSAVLTQNLKLMQKTLEKCIYWWSESK